MYSVRALLFFFTVATQAADTAQCYFPAGDLATGYTPCTDTTDNAHSWCCSSPDSVCTENGYCVGNNGLFYRGACTDSTFASPSCPQMCKDELNTTFSAFFNCADPGTYSQTWCCATESTDSCCGSGFSIDFGNPFQANALQTITVTATQTVSTPSAASSSISSHISTSTSGAASATSSSANSSSSGNNNETVIGVGVGVGLGVGLLAIAAVLYTIFSQRRRRKQLQTTIDEKTKELDAGRQLHEQKAGAAPQSGPPMEELDAHTARHANEIAAGRQRYELDHD